MPIYEYACDNCGHQFELLQKVSDPVTTDCLECQKQDVKRLVSATSFRLKGSGWYETDFKNKPKAKSTEASTGKASAKTAAPSDAKTTKKTDSSGSTTQGS